MQRKPLSALAIKAIDTILPPRCVVSGEIVDYQGMVAPKVWGSLDFIANPLCRCCGMPFDFESEIAADEIHCASCIREKPEFSTARAVLIYNDASRSALLSFKHGDQTHMVPAFVPWLKKAGAEMLEDADYILPVPLHTTRLITRRYNQAALIASALAKEVGIKYLPDGLKRVRATPSQGHKRAKDRFENVKRAFAVGKRHAARLDGKKIILVDDVFTTGATVRECTKILLKAGAREVHVLTIARVLRGAL